ncbi:glycosyltransferase family 4 protein [Streptomyces sp. B6B3]|uniref:glycosyltransferase family 4 protein n=1 Tax=Streptomyces sp. B6B3 TaxID=3153570 RepID=UPI00325E86F9
MSGHAAPASGRAPLHVVQLLGRGGAGAGSHVRSLSAGLVARGLRVTICASPAAERRWALSRVGARFVPVSGFPQPGRPGGVPSGPEAVSVLRAVCSDADLVHAHGNRAGLLGSLALGRRPVPLVVTWHAVPPVTRGGAALGVGGMRAGVRRLTESWVARSASVLLAATPDLVTRARRRGASDARLAPVALPTQRRPDPPPREGQGYKLRAEIGALDRPLLVTSVRLERGADADALEMLLTAARGWRGLVPQPLLLIAGEGPQRAAVQRRVDREGLPVLLLGHRDEAFRQLAAADLVVFVVRWAARAPLALEALRRGIPLVATAVGGVPDLVGDAGVLVPFGDPAVLGRAVADLLADPDRRAALADAGRLRAGSWPTEDTTVAQVLSVYDELVTAP